VLSEALFEIVGMSCVVAAIGAVEDINPKRHFTESCYMGKLMGYLLRRGYANDRLSPNGLGLLPVTAIGGTLRRSP
jgi:hypothetical protein